MLDNKVPKWQQRLFVFEAIYSDLILAKNTDNMYDSVYNLVDWSDFEKQIYNNYLINKSTYIQAIEGLLSSNWSLDRLNVPSLALLLEAMAEFNAVGTSHKVLIHQSIITSKKYCHDDEHKFINALLDNYLNSKCLIPN